MSFRSLRIAFNFLTTLPISLSGEWSEEDSGKSAAAYPFVGVVIGLIAAVFCWLCGKIFPPGIAAILTVTMWVVLTGGLHLDGLSDCCDGFFYAGTPEKRLQIMKDTHHGTFAVLGVCLTLLLKTACIAGIAEKGNLMIFPLAAALGRLGILVMIRLPLANPNGMAASLKRSIPPSALWVGAVFPLLIALFLYSAGLPALLAAGALFFLVGRLALSKIGGINGDVLGLTVELTEVVVLMIPNLIFFNGTVE